MTDTLFTLLLIVLLIVFTPVALLSLLLLLLVPVGVVREWRSRRRLHRSIDDILRQGAR